MKRNALMSESRDDEEIIDPAIPIIDPHHHLWFVPQPVLDAMALEGDNSLAALARIYRQRPRYLFDDLLQDVSAGHNVRATVFVEVHAMYRRHGPEAMQSVGEVEFANGMAAMGASGTFGDTRICAAIVGGIDLRRGDAARDVMIAHIAAGGGRYRGFRCPGVAYDASLPGFNRALHSEPRLLCDRRFRAGFRHLNELGLHYEAFQLEPQLPDLVDLARAFPDTQIVLNHVGMPVGFGAYVQQHQERFPIWRQAIRDLATLPNVVVKLGGLGNPLCGLPSSNFAAPATSAQLAEEWRPYIETCIEAFGVQRCMFESNVPVDSVTASYTTIWNAFKRIVGGASDNEKASLFLETAARVYGIGIDGSANGTDKGTTD